MGAFAKNILIQLRISNFFFSKAFEAKTYFEHGLPEKMTLSR
jgi:hypothetical protein